MPVKLKISASCAGRLSDRIKTVLKEAIFAGDLKPGEKLPTEERIASALKVSKVTVREALREMEAEGMIEKRRGTRGGSFVAEPNCAKISDLVGNYLRIGGVTPEQVTEFRLMLEPSMVALAAERRTKTDMAAIRACITAFERSLAGGTVDRVLGIEFHRLIAEACHNPLISAVMAAISTVFEDIIAAVPMSVEDGRIDLDFCKRFCDCLEQRRPQEAFRLMQDHFEVLNAIIQRSHGKRTVGDPHRAFSRRRGHGENR